MERLTKSKKKLRANWIPITVGIVLGIIIAVVALNAIIGLGFLAYKNKLVNVYGSYTGPSVTLPDDTNNRRTVETVSSSPVLLFVFEVLAVLGLWIFGTINYCLIANGNGTYYFLSVLYFLTCGGCKIWSIVNTILYATGGMWDGSGMPIPKPF